MFEAKRELGLKAGKSHALGTHVDAPRPTCLPVCTCCVVIQSRRDALHDIAPASWIPM